MHILITHFLNNGKVKHIEKYDIVDVLTGSYAIIRSNSKERGAYWQQHVNKADLACRDFDLRYTKIQLIENDKVKQESSIKDKLI